MNRLIANSHGVERATLVPDSPKVPKFHGVLHTIRDCMHWGLEVQLHQLKKRFRTRSFKGNYEAPASFGIGLSRKDVGLATELGRQHNMPMPIAALVEQTMIHAINRGWSDQSTASLFRLQEEAASIEVRK